MLNDKRHKKALKTTIPAVWAFASYLDELIKARTSENKLVKAAGVGNTKLAKYLDGTDLPDERVLERYILEPLGTFGELEQREYTNLMRLHREACQVLAPKRPTDTDQIKFLEEDLAKAKESVAQLTEQLEEAREKNRVAGEENARLANGHGLLSALVETTKLQVASLEHELEREKAELQKSERNISQKLGEFAERKREEMRVYQEKISDLEVAVGHYVHRNANLQNKVDHLLKRLQQMHQQNGMLRERSAEERRLFMKLVVHSADGSAFRRELHHVHQRLERSEGTIARLSVTNENLTATNRDLAAELDRVTQERDFLLAAQGQADIREAPVPADGIDGSYVVPRYTPDPEPYPSSSRYDSSRYVDPWSPPMYPLDGSDYKATSTLP